MLVADGPEGVAWEGVVPPILRTLLLQLFGVGFDDEVSEVIM